MTVEVVKDESIETQNIIEENIVKVEAKWPENNPFASTCWHPQLASFRVVLIWMIDVINGQQNYLDVLFENKTPKDVNVKSMFGEFRLVNYLLS